MQKKNLTDKRKYIFIVLGAFIGCLLLLYLIFGFYYKSHYLPGTCVNDVSISGLSYEKANEKLTEVLSDYNLIVYDRDSNTYNLYGSNFGFSYKQDSVSDTLSSLMSQQSSFSWPAALFNENVAELDFSQCYDSDDLTAAIQALACFDADTVTEPVDAHIAVTEDGSGFEIVPEVIGTQLNTDVVIPKIISAVNNLATDITLEDEDYNSPEIYSDDERLASCVSEANAWLGATITYDIGDNEEAVDSSQIAEWLNINDDFSITLDEDAITVYVQKLASAYNTYGDKREFKTALGDTVTIGGGDYGWVIDKDAEKAQIITDIKAGQAVEREPVYSQTAVSRNSNDIGDTYIELDYTNQHLWYYKNGSVVFDTDMVSGNISRGNGSPDGVYKIVYKKSPATLVGEDYESDVQYFMVFAYNVGIHDASWRSTFGGDLYKTSGSHGCINIDESAATKLYDILETDTPVVAYYREAVTLTANNAKISNAYSYVDPNAVTTE